MKSLIFIIILVVGFIAFQNCQKNSNIGPVKEKSVEVSAGSQTSSESLKYEYKLTLNQQKLISLHYRFQESEIIKRNTGSFEMLVEKSLNIDLNDGTIKLETSVTSSPSSLSYCLSAEELSEFKNILTASEICKASPINDGRMCAQVMRVPYATLVSDIEKYELGSATDSCGSNLVDLCDQTQSEQLQKKLNDLFAQYKTKVCQ